MNKNVIFKCIILLFFLVSTEIVKSQTREYSFNNNAQNEGLSITRSDDACITLRHAIKSMRLDSVVDHGYSGYQIIGHGIHLPAQSGAPNIPIECHYIAIPNGASVRIGEVNVTSQTILNVDLLAAPPLLLETDTTPITYEKDSSIYFTNAYYPAQVVSVSDTFSIRGVNTVAVSIAPYQYNPVTKELIVHHDLNVSILFEGGNGQFGDSRLRSPYWDPILMQSLVNYDQLPVMDYEARMDNWLNTRPSGCEYLIVIPNNEDFRPYANQLKEYRIKQGILTEVMSLSEMMCSDAVQLKAYFHNAFNTWEITPVAVCLFGDHNNNSVLGIPGEPIYYERNDDPPAPLYITDNGYADVNGDGLPDMTFSRLVAADTTEARIMVSKQLEYEYVSPVMNPDYYDHPITSACWCTTDCFQICAEAIGGYWRNNGKAPIRINALLDTIDIPGEVWSTYSNAPSIIDYFGPDGLGYIPSSPDSLGGWTGGTGDSILLAIDSGSMLLFHRDHGDIDRWLVPEFGQRETDFLTNDGNLTFVISVDCQTGAFDYAEKNCLIENFMRSTDLYTLNNAGAVGCIAPTYTTYSHINDVYAWGLFDYFMPDFMPDNNYASDSGVWTNYEGNWLPAFANVAGKYFLQRNNWLSNNNEVLWKKQITYNAYTTHCDAFLRLFSVVPQTMTVVHPSQIDMSQGYFYVTAPAGATIALTVGNTILKVATATGEPQVLNFEPQNADTIDLVITKQDYLRYEASVTDTEYEIVGPNSLEVPNCDNYTYTLQINNPELFTYVWSGSQSVQYVSSSSNTATFRPISTGNGAIIVDVYYYGQHYARYTKSVNVTSNYTVISTSPISITTNTAWSTGNYLLQSDAEVEPNATLTITATVFCSPDAKIIVKPNGRLRIVGGHLKGICEDEQWQGIQVWGNFDKHQMVENGQYYQGYVELCDSAMIENAIIGIDVWKPNDYATTGGIVNAENAYFINNAMAVYFHPYENQYENPNQNGTIVVKDNVSRFKNCEFIVNDNYLGPEFFEKHVSLYGVRGVKFSGCNFVFQDNRFSSIWPTGIHAYDAGFSLTGACNSNNHFYPCQVLDNSTFDGFYKAVVSINDGSVGVRSVTVKNTDFTNNNFGIYAFKSGFATILNSNFSIGDSLQCAAGIIAENTPNFIIEQDTFNLADQTPYYDYGVVIKNSKSQNLVYKNVFNGLYCANLSIGRNNTYILPRNSVADKPRILGLEYCCNENTNNYCDFYVLGGNNIYKLGIQTNQGTTNEPANNTFSAGSSLQFMNYGNYGINYFHNGHPNGTPSFTAGVTLIPTADSIGCPSHYGNDGISYYDTLTPVLSDIQRLQREADYYEAYTIYNAIKALYGERLNGGDTEAEIADIRAALPSDMWELRSQLLGHSPYLTNEVLTATADRIDIFPQSVLFEILSSNPDELKNDTLISYLQNMDPPLPDYMISMLRQISNGITARTVMESQMAKYCQKFRQAAGDIIRSILSDTLIDKTALVGWLGNMEDLESDREIISIYLEDGDFTHAFALANMLPTLYGLTDENLTDHNNYMSMLELYYRLYHEGSNTMKLDETDRAAVEYFADNSTGTAQAMAQAIMMGAYGYHYDDCPSGMELSGIGNRNMNMSFSDVDKNKALGLTVGTSPNPANTWVTVDYTLPMGANKAQLKLANVYGIVVATYDLMGEEGQKVLDLRSLVSGVYTYTVYCGKLSQSGKLVIVK